MEIQLHQREKEGILILDLQGHLTEGSSEAKLRAEIVSLAEAKTVKVILNFAGMLEIDADGVSAVIFCAARLTSSGGTLRLLNLSPRHLDLMLLTKLNTVSPVFTNEQDAVNSFFPERAGLRYDILEFIEEPHKPPEL